MFTHFWTDTLNVREHQYSRIFVHVHVHVAVSQWVSLGVTNVADRSRYDGFGVQKRTFSETNVVRTYGKELSKQQFGRTVVG